MSTDPSFTPRILSIQSHVVSGYVGNKSATFPLQVLGFEVDTINSVQFSNHTGYGFWKGQILTSDDLDDLTEGLAKNNLNYYDYLLTGYIGSDSFLKSVAQQVKQLKKINPDLLYVCDPVMGDNGQMYVPEELLPIYRDEIIPLADILTPNQYEAELLTGETIKTLDDALKVIKIFHDKGINTIALSSTDLGTNESLLALASCISGNGKQTVCKIEIPKLPASFTGTGDLFAALFLAWWDKTSRNLRLTLENTVSTMQAVLRNTLEYKGHRASSTSAGKLELRLIQSKRSIEQPVIDVYGKMMQN